MSLSEKIKRIRSRLGLNQTEMAKKLGIHPQPLSRYERGELSPSAELLIHIAQRLNINPIWLLYDTGDMFGQEPAAFDHTPPDGFTFVPLYDVKAAAGAGYINGTEDIKDFLAFKTSWIKTTLRSIVADLFLIHLIGDSMEPTLKEGDIILGDKGKINRKKWHIYYKGRIRTFNQTSPVPGGFSHRHLRQSILPKIYPQKTRNRRPSRLVRPQNPLTYL